MADDLRYNLACVDRVKSDVFFRKTYIFWFLWNSTIMIIYNNILHYMCCITIGYNIRVHPPRTHHGGCYADWWSHVFNVCISYLTPAFLTDDTPWNLSNMCINRRVRANILLFMINSSMYNTLVICKECLILSILTRIKWMDPHTKLKNKHKHYKY